MHSPQAQPFHSTGTQSRHQDGNVPSVQVTAELNPATSHVGGLLRRRARFIVRGLRYAVLHRSFRHVGWALAAEGTKW
jgi:hypothetical protein